MEQEIISFASEDCLVVRFCENLNRQDSPWPSTNHRREFGYLRGRTDVIAIDGLGRVLAFEAKLTNWRAALHQAYRNTCFADMSFVVMPPHNARIACRAIYEFSRRSVGLCTVSDCGIKILIEAPKVSPLQPWLRKSALDMLKD